MPKPEKLEEDRQLSLYQIGVMRTWPDAREVKLVWHYLAFDKEMTITKSPKDLEAIRKETIKLIDEIESAKEFKPNTSALCDWCSYSDICPAMGHQAKIEELPPNKYLKDNGVKLVNKLTELKVKRSEINASIKDKVEEIDEEIGQVEEAILAYCGKEKLTRLVGSTHQVELRSAEKFEMPGKNDDGREELEEIIKKAGKWDEVSALDKGLLEEALSERNWDDQIRSEVDKYVEISREVKISHTKRKDLEEE